MKFQNLVAWNLAGAPSHFHTLSQQVGHHPATNASQNCFTDTEL